MGSTSYITAKNGSISQHVEYIAFGEVLFDEHSSSFSSPYLFNGKELDRETNLSYYGARYYDAKTSLWLNGDPLAEKYPNVGAYVYCLNNPIVFVDPDGKDPITGIIDAVSSFALDVGMDYFGGMLIEGKSSQEAYNDIGWASATWGAVGSYAISSVTPTGTATAIKIEKFAKSRAGKMIIGTVTKMTTKIIDNYSKGKYDTDGHFDMDKLLEGEDGLMNIFLESSIETLVEQGFGNKAEEMLGSLKIENKALIRKVNKMLNKVENGESPTRIKKYFKKVKEQGNKALKSTNNLLRQKAKDAVQKGAISKGANQYRKNKQKENDK